MDGRDARELVGRVESALGALEGLPDDARECALDALAEVLAMYGEGLRRALETVAARSGPNTVERLVSDELVGHLLMVHGLHPDQQKLPHGSGRSEGPHLVQIEDRRAGALQ